jgi:hypothetical protein
MADATSARRSQMSGGGNADRSRVTPASAVLKQRWHGEKRRDFLRSLHSSVLPSQINSRVAILNAFITWSWNEGRAGFRSYDVHLGDLGSNPDTAALVSENEARTGNALRDLARFDPKCAIQKQIRNMIPRDIWHVLCAVGITRDLRRIVICTEQRPRRARRVKRGMGKSGEKKPQT